MAVGMDAINQFVSNRSAGDRLVVKNNELHLVNKSSIRGWSCFKAKFGCGGASMRKVASHINENRNNLFPDYDKDESIANKNAINTFIVSYNAKRTFSFKKGRSIKAIEAETIAIFGAKQWAKAGFKIKDASPIPANLQQIYSAPCPIWENENKTVGDTHILFLVPKDLNGKRTTVNRIRKITKKYIPTYFFHINEKILKSNDGHKYFNESYWVLMTKGVVPATRGIPFDWNQIPDNYDLPHIIEADICMLTQYLRGRNPIDRSKLFFRDEATYCYETDNHGTRSLVGLCDQNGFGLGYFIPSCLGYGMAAVQRL